jgi:Tol biopolymer transport system component
VFAVGAIGVGVVAWGRFAEQPQLMRMTLQTPEKAAPFYWVNHPMISPDGRRVVFPAAVDGKSGLWLRDLDALSARLLPGTDGAILPFWSPDSRWVAFFVEGTAGKLKKIDVTGGSAITLCDVIRGREGAWNQDGVIVYGVFPGGLFRVPATGGIPTPLTVPDAAATEVNHRSPWFLPDGRRFLYTARSDDPEKTRIYVDSIDAKPGSTTRREVLAANSNAVYVPRIHAGLRGSADDGYLLFVRDSTLMAQPFDAASARTTGNAVPVAEQVDYDSYGSSQGQFSASRNGILVYTSGSPVSGEAQLTWFHRTGKPGGTVGSPGLVGAFSLSPDGSTVAAVRGGASRPFDIWLHDLAHGTASRFTFGPHNNMLPVWSPDGSRLAYYRDHTGINLPWQKAASGTGLEERLDEDPRTHVLTDWSRDGRYLIETVSDPKTDTDIWVFPTFGDKKPFPYVRTEFAEGQGKLSPDGKFLAYRSSESGRSAVYVQTFPEHGGKWQISNGSQPVWSRDGRELYFLSADNKMMAVEVKGSGKNFDAGVPKALFPVPNQAQFDVSKDGRFLIHVPQAKAATSVPLTVVVNWQAGLKK